MQQIKVLLGILTLFSFTVAMADNGKVKHGYRVAGVYEAKLDLTPIWPVPRIEALTFTLHPSGAANWTSEHEVDDLSSGGVGVWQRASHRRVLMGLQDYRMGIGGACALVFGGLPPDNCLLKLGTTLERTSKGRLEGKVFLTLTGPDGIEVPLNPDTPLDFTMRRLSIKDFPVTRRLP